MEQGSENVEPGKIFVGGLSWETTKENLEAYFAQYGQVKDAVIMMDPVTKKPRGFGFVTFQDPASVLEVLKGGPHVLDTKTVDPKPATVKNPTSGAPGQQQPGGGLHVKKIFVGGIAAGTSDEDVRTYFSQFGDVTEVDLKYDKNTNRMRGFGFVAFDSEDVVDKLCETHFHQINGKTVEVKKAEPRFSAGGGGGGGYAPYRGGMGGGGFGGHGYGSPAAAAYGGGGGRGGYGSQYGYNNYGGGGYGAHPQQYPYAAAGYGYNQGGYGGQYPTGHSASYGYEGYPSSQQTRATGDQSRSDYSTGYGYGQNYGQGGHMQPQDVSYNTRASYGTTQEAYGQQGSYNYTDPSTYSYQDLQGGGGGYGGGRGGTRSSYGAR